MQSKDLRGMSGVYAVINKSTGRFYIGSARDLYNRRKAYSKGFNKILRGVNNPWGVSRHMVEDVAVYGRTSFTFRVLEMFPRDEWEPDFHYLHHLEDTYLQSANANLLYNTHEAYHAEIPLVRLQAG